MIYNFPMRFIFLFTFLFSISYSFSQTTKAASDSTKKIFPKDSLRTFRSPKKAAILSTCLPGLGQAYDKKYWKIPIIYAALGTTIYLMQHYHSQLQNYKQAYKNKDTAYAFNYYFPSSSDTYTYTSRADLETQEQHFRKFRDLTVILTALFYTLNIADAYVDAHLSTFDVSDNLSMNVLPSINFISANQKPSAGLTLSFKF